MKHLQIENITLDDFMKELNEKLKSVLEEALKKSSNSISDDSLMSRQEVADFFSVSLPTIHQWMNTGILPYFHIGRKTRFKKRDILNALVPQKNLNRKS